MKCAVFTPTFHFGGLDINYASLVRQTHQDFVWIIGDELFSKRVLNFYTKDMKIYHFEPPKIKEGNPTNLAATYNKGMEIARSLGADIFVSMQDYFWIPNDGLEKFVNVINQHNCLVTGLASLTNDPTADEVYDPEGLWTLFREPYKPEDKPTSIWWKDVRANMHPPAQLDLCTPEHFENNWSAWPLKLTKGIKFDEEYDQGVAFENQDFAWQCITKADAKIMIDTTNHALGLPHKRYFPLEEGIRGPYCERNKQRCDLKWVLARRQTGLQ